MTSVTLLPIFPIPEDMQTAGDNMDVEINAYRTKFATFQAIQVPVPYFLLLSVMFPILRLSILGAIRSTLLVDLFLNIYYSLVYQSSKWPLPEFSITGLVHANILPGLFHEAIPSS